MTKYPLWLSLIAAVLLFGSVYWMSAVKKETVSPEKKAEDDVWRQKLSPAEYEILREKGTERPFSSPLNDEKRPGTYVTADTGEPVFRSEDKFDSGTGWPSFTKPITPDAIVTAEDNGLFGERIEVLSKAGGHLGHVFTDGPAPTGLRYCMNGLVLRFVPDDAESESTGDSPSR